MLSRDEILKCSDIKTEKIKVPEWGGEVLVRGMSARQRSEFHESISQKTGDKLTVESALYHARMAVRVLVDEKGAYIFTDADAEMLANKSAGALQRIFIAGARLSGLLPDDVEAAKENFDSGPNAG